VDGCTAEGGTRILAGFTKYGTKQLIPQAPHPLLLELQRMKPEGSLQVWIVKSDGLGILRVDLKGLEYGPVFNVMSILRAVVDSSEAVVEDDA
jgi:hypothetical protein